MKIFGGDIDLNLSLGGENFWSENFWVKNFGVKIFGVKIFFG